jgi:hypothetical protein
MSFDPSQRLPIGLCPVCLGQAGVYQMGGWDRAVHCLFCGKFQIERATIDDLQLPFTGQKQQALARHVIRKMTAAGTLPLLTKEFFQALGERTLPSPAEASDNLLIWIAEQADNSPGELINFNRFEAVLPVVVGVRTAFDLGWIIDSLSDQHLLQCQAIGIDQGRLTALGWQRVDELKRARVASEYAFFARKFDNPDLDGVFVKCLAPAVRQTGYELRIAPQQAGLVDALIEDGIRRCRFLIVDLSDDNGGAYWEAGFAEGLGKPVIYICREGVTTHFDTNHRHTVRWDLSSLDATANKLKAVIRNTLLGDAKQTDE